MDDHNCGKRGWIVFFQILFILIAAILITSFIVRTVEGRSSMAAGAREMQHRVLPAIYHKPPDPPERDRTDVYYCPLEDHPDWCFRDAHP